MEIHNNHHDCILLPDLKPKITMLKSVVKSKVLDQCLAPTVPELAMHPLLYPDCLGLGVIKS